MAEGSGGAHRRIREVRDGLQDAVRRNLVPLMGSQDPSAPPPTTTTTLGHVLSDLVSPMAPSSLESGDGASPPPAASHAQGTAGEDSFAINMGYVGEQQLLQRQASVTLRRNDAMDASPGVSVRQQGIAIAPQHAQAPAPTVRMVAHHRVQLPSRSTRDVETGVDERRASRGVAEEGVGGDPADDGETEDSVPALLRQIMGQNPELRSTLQLLERYIPCLLLVFVKLLIDHGTGIIVFVCLMITSFHSNSVVKQQVSRQDRRSSLALIAVLVYLVSCIVLIYYVFQDEKLFNCAIFLPPQKVESLYELIWLVGVNDFILKFFAVIVKTCLVLSPPSWLPYQRRGKYLLFVERASQLHRELAPIQVWLVYLLNGYEKIPGKVLGVILVACYMVTKGKMLLRSGKAMRLAVSKLLQVTSYGHSPSAEQVKATGGACPICYDAFRTPTILHCRHIFCEDCLSTWFDRERTCPLCRAQVTEDPEWRDGSTSQLVQLY